ncbi:hypothetical protein BBI17_009963, partial [Phytophthora kernoviae]
GNVSAEVKGVDQMKLEKMVSGDAIQSADAAQIEAAAQRFLRTRTKEDVDGEERSINKLLMLSNSEHKFDIFDQWYKAGHSSMWAFDRLKVGTSDKYEKYRPIYNQYAIYSKARSN